MKNSKRAVRDSVLTVIWLITAAMVLILTVVYLERLQKLYAKADQDNAQKAVSSAEMVTDGKGQSAGETQGSGNGMSSNGTAAGNNGNGEAGGQDGITDADNAGGNVTDTAGNYSTDDNTGNVPGGDASDAGAGGTAGNDAPEGNTGTGEAGNFEGNANGSTAGDTENSANGNTENTTSGNVDGNGNSTENGTETGTGNGTGNETETGSRDIDGSEQAAAGTEDAGEGISEEARKAREKYDYSLGLDPEKPIIALSFDDGPSIYTSRIVAALQANHVEATFFMVGYNVREYKDEVRLIYNAGMEIGNHTIDHKKLTELSKADIKSEVFDNEDLINAVVPVGRVIVRPPYGSHNSTVRSVVSRPMFNWTVDSLDWKTRNADSIVAQIQQDAKDGYIILMHDIYETTAEAAERIIPWLLDQGYQVTCISKMFKARGERTEDGEVYRNVAPAQ
ncbi:MAG: polysaccharide deacetylase family protein [Lachnospiraceae bacterium]|nr:polysaccharide deacetylase family protein [Lachnospiraceae bacterium]